jgi:Rab-GTPase-TBC domain
MKSSRKKRWKRAKRGIDGDQRREMWLRYSGAATWLRTNNGAYGGLLELLNESAKSGTTLLPFEREIRDDMSRTLPGLWREVRPDDSIDDIREAEQSLYRILQVYALRNRTIGYSQAMNYLVAVPLLYMNESEAFAMLVVLVERLLPMHYYGESMLASHIDQRVFQALVRRRLPAVVDAFDALGHDTSYLRLSCGSWLLTVFFDALPVLSVLRVWDVFLVDGIASLFSVGLAALACVEPRLSTAASGGDSVAFFNLLTNMRSEPELADIDALLSVAGSRMLVSRREIVRLRAHYTPLVTALLEREEERRNDALRKRQQAAAAADDDDDVESAAGGDRSPRSPLAAASHDVDERRRLLVSPPTSDSPLSLVQMVRECQQTFDEQRIWLDSTRQHLGDLSNRLTSLQHN